MVSRKVVKDVEDPARKASERLADGDDTKKRKYKTNTGYGGYILQLKKNMKSRKGKSHFRSLSIKCVRVLNDILSDLERKIIAEASQIAALNNVKTLNERHVNSAITMTAMHNGNIIKRVDRLHNSAMNKLNDILSSRKQVSDAKKNL